MDEKNPLVVVIEDINPRFQSPTSKVTLRFPNWNTKLFDFALDSFTGPLFAQIPEIPEFLLRDWI